MSDDFLSVELAMKLANAEFGLALRDRFFDELSNLAPFGFAIFGPDADLEYLSPAIQEMSGMTLEACQQFGWWSAFPREDGELLVSRWQQAQALMSPMSASASMRDKDGVLHGVHLTIRPVFSKEHQEVERWVGWFQSIDVQLDLESKVRTAERKFREFAEDAPALVWISDEKGRFTYVNRRMCEYAGLRKDQVLENGWLNCVVEEDQELLNRTLRAYALRATDFSIEVRMRGLVGLIRTFQIKGAPRYSNNSKFHGFTGICVDITDQIESQSKLEQAIKDCSEVVGTFNLMPYTRELDGECTFKCGSEADDWSVHPEDRSIFDSVLDHTGNFDLRYRMVNCQGEVSLWADRGSLVYEGGVPVRIQGVRLNLTALMS